ncbi:RICIN domain-containing protein [Streptomyces bottropensis]|uniref:RICIN domain-containing protein n=1 Tax=Streptomyces bottropensis TaxID=42235 RepID=UPI0036956EF6
MATACRNREDNSCLGIPGFSTNDGTQLHLWDCNGDSNQKWTTLTGPSPFRPRVRVSFHLRSVCDRGAGVVVGMKKRVSSGAWLLRPVTSREPRCP